jgi:CubicO group peptidase (beta-lactamase class C family)
MEEWLQLCQSPDLDRFTTWASENSSAEGLKRGSAAMRAQIYRSDCTANGGFRLVKVKKSDAQSIEVLVVGEKSGFWNNALISVDGEGKLDRSGLAPATPPESALPTKLSDAALADAIKSAADRAAQAGLFSGIVVVARGTKPFVTVSEGYADREKRTPITGNTQFTLGSMGKMFTAAAIGQLVDQGKISFNDTVGKFFPDYPNQTIREKATVGMLLSHTAGMGDFLSKRTPEMMKNGVKRASEYMPLYDKDEPSFAPGTSWAYSNAGLALVGAIVEKASGEDYPDYIRKHIFAPAGMINSDPNNIPYSNIALVTPYTKRSATGPTADWHEAEHDVGSPAGGAISTADDLIRFAESLRSGKIVSKAVFDQMTQQHGATPWGGHYGYAMDISDVFGRTVVGHGGGFPGVNTNLHIILDSPYTVVVLANLDPPAEATVGEYALASTVEKAKQGK